MPAKKTGKNKNELRNLFLALCALLAGCAIGVIIEVSTTSDDVVPVPTDTRSIEVRFSPKGGCTELITKAIDDAKENIYVAAYSLTSEPIVDALLQAKERGVQIRLSIDKEEYEKSRGKPKKTADQIMRLKGVIDLLLVDTRNGLSHNKVIVIDEKAVISGSFNFDKNAEEKNRENVVYIRNDRKLAEEYIRNWLSNASYKLKKKKKKACIPIEEYLASKT